MIAIKNKKKGTVNDVLTFEEERRLLEIAKERAKIIEKGDSEEYLPGDIVDLWKIEKINKSLAKKDHIIKSKLAVNNTGFGVEGDWSEPVAPFIP